MVVEEGNIFILRSAKAAFHDLAAARKGRE
jgi:hypothetical protein